MERVTSFRTSDGEFHSTLDLAARHADKRYGLALDSLARKAVKCEKYTAMLEFIDTYLDDFVKLKAIKDDMQLKEDPNADTA